MAEIKEQVEQALGDIRPADELLGYEFGNFLLVGRRGRRLVR